MKDRGILLLLLASAGAFLVSLYLPWQESSQVSVNGGSSLFFSSVTGISVDGWGLFGQAAAVLALGLCGAAIAAVARPRVASRLPLATCAVAVGFFAVMSAFDTRNEARVEGAPGGVAVHAAVGSYLALASAIAALVSAIGLRRTAFGRRPSPATACGVALTGALLVALLVPVLTFHVSRQYLASLAGYDALSSGITLVIFIGGVACFGLPLWTGTPRPYLRLSIATAIAVLVGGYLSVLGAYLHWPWEMWLLLGSSLGLVALALGTRRGLRIDSPSAPDAAAVAAAVSLLVSMFLPWGGGSMNGWESSYSDTAGGLTVLQLALLLGAGRFAGELAVGTAIYVMAAGFEITSFSSLRYGAALGCAGTALLLLTALRLLRRVDAQRLRVRILPILASSAFLAIPVVALTGRASLWFELESPWRLYWLGVAAILGALLLLGRWLTAPRADPALIVVPFGLLAFTALNLVEHREEISWLGIASVVLCLLLVAFAWVERTRGLENFRVPEEIWRVDRLPGEN